MERFLVRFLVRRPYNGGNKGEAEHDQRTTESATEEEARETDWQRKNREGGDRKQSTNRRKRREAKEGATEQKRAERVKDSGEEARETAKKERAN